MKKVYKIFILLLVLVLVITPGSVFAFTKKETVFTNLDSNGKVKRNIVNNNLSFIDKETKDETILKDVLNISGDEKLNIKDNKITFETNGKDLTYQGVTTKELPIGIDISYFLDNEKVNPNNLSGKKGHITISIDLENRLYNEKYNLHTPFVITAALIIKGNNGSNIEINNGKSLNTGTRNIVVAVAAPGLYDDLKIDELNDLDNITIEYDTDCYEKSDIYLVATPKVLENGDLEVLDKLDKLSEKMNELEEGMDKLEDGSKSLAKGTSALKIGTKSLKNGLIKALEGSEKLSDGSKEVNDNLSLIINGLNESKTALDEKSKSLGDKLVEINTLKENNTEAINKLNTANSTIIFEVSNMDSRLDITKDNFIETVKAMYESESIDETAYKSLCNLKTQYDSNVGLITLLTYDNETINTLLTSLTNTSSEIQTSLGDLNTYLTKLKDEGTSALENGQDALSDGILELYNGSKKLYNGSEKLESGSKKLSNGIEKINKDGITLLTDKVKVIDSYSDKVKKLVELSKDYKGYASSNSDAVTFIFRVNE